MTMPMGEIGAQLRRFRLTIWPVWAEGRSALLGTTRLDYIRKQVDTEKAAGFEEDEVCACCYCFASGLAASAFGLGFGAALGFGVQKSGETAATSAGGLLSSGRKR
jgi:hypothetical protein